jgi:hypothetical protein
MIGRRHGCPAWALTGSGGYRSGEGTNQAHLARQAPARSVHSSIPVPGSFADPVEPRSEAIRRGAAAWDAVPRTTDDKLRRIFATARLANPSLIPIGGKSIWSPTACAMVGGIPATIFPTLPFLPGT